MLSKRSLQRQRGFTLIEIAIAATLAAIAVAVGLYFQAQEMSYSVARAQADQLKVLNNSLGTYETVYFTNLVNNTAIPGVANIYAPTVTELKNIGVLDNSFSPNSYYSGTYNTSLRLAPTGCTAGTCDIFGLTYLTTPILGRDGKVDNGAVGEAMLRAGGDAGYSNDLNPGTLSGGSGSWSTPNPLGAVSGILAMRVGYGSQGFTQFLRRDGTLPMTGSLDMGNQNIKNANAINANTETLTGDLNAANANLTGNITAVNAFLSNFLEVGNNKFYVGNDGKAVATDYYDSTRGHWVSTFMGRWVQEGTWAVWNGTTLGKPTCAEGGTPRVIITPQGLNMMDAGGQQPSYGTNSSPNPAGISWNVWADDYGSYWYMHVVAFAQGTAWAGGQALAAAYCFYW